MADEVEALRAELAAAQAELQRNKDEKERVAAELEVANAENEMHAKKKAYLDETGLTDTEFEDKKTNSEVPSYSTLDVFLQQRAVLRREGSSKRWRR